MIYVVLYCYWNNPNVIKNIEIIEANKISSVFESTDRNLETNIVIPLNKHNIKMIKSLVRDLFNLEIGEPDLVKVNKPVKYIIN